MATRGIEPITLPWKRPEKGVSAAELGASFRVEQREDGWHCTVRVGRRAEVLATGLRRLRDAQCRAEAHAATLPEVAAAKAKAEAEAAKPAAKGGKKGRAAAAAPVPEVRAPEPERPAEEAAPVQPSVRAERRPRTPRFEQVSDGCICGKIEGGTWVADPAGKVSVPEGTDPAVAQEICRVAAKHYAAQRQKTAPAGRTAKPAPKAAAKPVADAAPVDPPRRAAKGKRSKNKAARKRLAAKLAAKPGARNGAKTAAEPEVETTARAAKKSTARAAKKPSARATQQTAGVAKKTKTATASAAKKTTASAAKKTTARTATASAAKTTARTATASAAKKPTARNAAQVAAPTDTAPAKRGRPRKGDSAVAQTEAKEATVGKKTGKASKGEACGCMTWTEAEGKARGEAKHGAFVIEPEGKKHALYFYDPDGQSRHLQSGEAGKLRKVAEEMAARGQPAPRAASAGDDAAMLKMFMAGAMEEET